MSRAWDQFWTGEQQGRGGCLPVGENRIEQVQQSIWREYARRLRRNAKVLDLATGDGRVMRWLLQARPDLKLHGVDSATHLPSPPKGTRSRARVAMEALPFSDQTFDVVTSQFGIEYADDHRAISELSRILRDNGSYRFLMHQADGPIVRHNLARTEELNWVLLRSGLIERAQAFIRTRAVMTLPTPPFFKDCVGEVRARFGANSAAEEFAIAVHQSIDRSRGSRPEVGIEAIGELKHLAEGEISRIRELVDAAMDEGKLRKFLKLLQSKGVAALSVQEAAERTGASSFAWLLDGRKC